MTRPDLLPPRVRLSHYGNAPVGGSPRFILLSPRTYLTNTPGQSGLMVLDRQGRLVWFQPVTTSSPFDFNVQRYKGHPVLSWWQGSVVNGYGVGTGQLAGTSYQALQQIQAGDGLKADLHELNLTPEGTALVTAYQQVNADLSSVGGKSKAAVLAGHFQEVELPSGRVLMDWDSLSHVNFSESYMAAPTGSSGVYDYFHINSVGTTPQGDLVVSARNTWAVYGVDRASGHVLWRLNGKRSDFTVAKPARFYWQHHARFHGAAEMSVFDDGSNPAEEAQSRGLLLNIDMARKTAGLKQAYLHPAGFLAANQGSVQVLDDGRVFVGWGNQPYFSEFAPDGTLLLDGELPIGYHSYRAYAQDWRAKAPGQPAVAARANPASGTFVYASWNGATDIDHWTVLAGSSPDHLEPVGSQDWRGFETGIAVNASGPHFAAVAEDAGGRILGRSPVVSA